MKPQVHLKSMAIENDNFIKVLETSKTSQVALMSIPVKQSIGEETHSKNDELYVVLEGEGQAVVADATYPITFGEVLFIPGGVRHDIRNTDKVRELKLLALHAPPLYPESFVQKTAAEKVGKKAF